MQRYLVRGCVAVLMIVGLGACGGDDAEKAKFESAAGALAGQQDSSVRALDSAGRRPQVDTTKLGAAKTESILTKARKSP
jgi:hypothetical protein